MMIFKSKSNFNRRGKKLWFNIVTEKGKDFYCSTIEINLETKETKINYTMLNNKTEIKLTGSDKEFVINKALEIAKEGKYL